MLEWEWYSDINTFRLFLHLLLKVNWKEGNFKGTKVERGSLVSSIGRLALETGLTEQEVKTALKHLKKTGEVTSKATSKFTVFTVVKYNQYQADNQQLTSEQPADNQQVTNEQPAANQQVTTIEEGKKEKREERKKGKREEEKEAAPPKAEPIPYSMIRELYNSVCGSYPRLAKLSEARKKAIAARFHSGYTLEDFKKMFQKAEESDFLKGKNDRNWSADFDWMIRDANMVKILEGKYNDDQYDGGRGENNEQARGEDQELKKPTNGIVEAILGEGYL